MQRARFYLLALMLHLVVLFWVNPVQGGLPAPKKDEKKYLEVTLSTEPGPAKPGPDSGPDDKAKAAVAPGPLVEDSPPPVAAVTPEPAPPPPTPEPPAQVPTPPPVIEPVPVVVVPEPAPLAVAKPLVEETPSSAASSSLVSDNSLAKASAGPVSGFGLGNAAQWSRGSGGNGHFYQAVYTPEGIDWLDAQKYALLHGGYLATINSAAENAFIFKLIDDAKFWKNIAPQEGYYSVGPWFGGYKSVSGWKWVNDEGVLAYTRWGPGEPDNRGGNQDRLLFYVVGPNRRQATWDDTTGAYHALGFVVEYNRDPATLPLNPDAANNYTGPVDQAPPRAPTQYPSFPPAQSRPRSFTQPPPRSPVPNVLRH